MPPNTNATETVDENCTATSVNDTANSIRSVRSSVAATGKKRSYGDLDEGQNEQSVDPNVIPQAAKEDGLGTGVSSEGNRRKKKKKGKGRDGP